MDNETTPVSQSTGTTPAELAVKTVATMAIVTVGVLVVGQVRRFRNRNQVEAPIDTTEE